MGFSLSSADMSGGLDTPPIAIAVALAALVFGAWLASILRSQRPPLRKGLMLVVVFALAFLGGQVAELLGRMSAVAMYSSPGVGIGFIGRPPQWLAPTAALVLALAFQGVASWLRFRPASRVRSQQGPR
jgi:hypothetical protein